MMTILIKFNYLFYSLLLISIFGCGPGSEIDNELKEIGRILPGSWKIEEFHSSQNGTGVILNGNRIFKDTILKDVGILLIPTGDFELINNSEESYSFSDLAFYYKEELQNIWITRLIHNSQGVLASFRKGIWSPSSEIGMFTESTRIFSRNVIIKIVSDNKLRLVDSNDPTKDLLILVRE